jgi:hypothetical protein
MRVFDLLMWIVFGFILALILVRGSGASVALAQIFGDVFIKSGKLITGQNV